MLNLINCGPIEFRNRVKQKLVFVYGAGRALESCLDIYFADVTIKGVIDRDTSLQGKLVRYQNKTTRIMGIDVFAQSVSEYGVNNCILLVSSPFYAADIIEQLDDVSALDGLETYLQVLIRNTLENTNCFDFPCKQRIIPKQIHYIWLGKKEIPDKLKKYIDTWGKNNPEYKIYRWDESNYDFNKTDFMSEAYQAKAWGFVSNYARLDIVYQYGGIYLDTDVEVIRNFDCLLGNEAFFCMGSADRVNTGCGFGSVPHNILLKEMMNEYKGLHFDINKGGVGERPGHTFIIPPLKKRGFQIVNEYQRIDNVVLYPKEVMSPLTIEGMPNFFSDKTVSIHHEEGSWKRDTEKKGLSRLELLIRNRLDIDN